MNIYILIKKIFGAMSSNLSLPYITFVSTPRHEFPFMPFLFGVLKRCNQIGYRINHFYGKERVAWELYKDKRHRSTSPNKLRLIS